MHSVVRGEHGSANLIGRCAGLVEGTIRGVRVAATLCWGAQMQLRTLNISLQFAFYDYNVCKCNENFQIEVHEVTRMGVRWTYGARLVRQ